MTNLPATIDRITSLSNEDLVYVAETAAKDATVTSGVVFAHCMRELANRFDKRSFINICEAIQRDLPYCAA